MCSSVHGTHAPHRFQSLVLAEHDLRHHFDVRVERDRLFAQFFQSLVVEMNVRFADYVERVLGDGIVDGLRHEFLDDLAANLVLKRVRTTERVAWPLRKPGTAASLA